MTFDSRWKNPQGNSPEQIYLWAQGLITELRKGDYISSVIEDIDGLTNAQLADMAAWTIKMRNNAAAGVPQDQTINQLTEETSVDKDADFVPLWDASAGTMDKVKPANLLPTSGLVLLNSGTISSAQATLDVALTAGYRGYELRFSNFVPATDDVDLYLRVSTDAGASYDATGYSYVGTVLRDGSTTAAGRVSTAANQIIVAGAAAASEAVSNVAAEGGASGTITIMNAADATIWPSVRYDTGWFSADAQSWKTNGRGTRETAQDTTHVRLVPESGDIATGKWALYGLA